MQLINPLITNLKPENIVVIDFETFYDKDYTLSGKLNMSEYIRDPRFLVHGAAIKVGTNKAKWIRGKDLRSFLVTLGLQNYAILAHNTQFDGFIVTDVYGLYPGAYLDTLAMARGTLGHATRHTLKLTSEALGLGTKDIGALENTKGKTELSEEEEKRLATYSINDAELCSQVFWKLYPSLPDEELELIHKTTKMFCEPVLETDKELLKQLIDSEVNKKSKLLEETNLTREDLLSAEKFAKALLDAGLSSEELPVKVSPSTGHSIFAFAKSDEDFKQLQKHINPKIRTLAEARLAIKSTIHETRAGRFLLNSEGGKKLPVSLNYCGAHTTRWSGGNKINLQNIPKGSGLRKSILAPDGMVLVVADSSQIEARLTAWLAGEDILIKAFKEYDKGTGPDIYKIMASKIYNKDIEDITIQERFIGKTCVLGLGFGMSGLKLKNTLASGALGPPMYISDVEAQKYVTIYRSTYTKIPLLWRKMQGILELMYSSQEGKASVISGATSLSVGRGWVRLPNQLFLQYPGLEYAGNIPTITSERPDQMMYRTNMGYTKIYGGLLTENIVQALARVFIGECMLQIDQKYRIVTMTHDEIVAVAPALSAEGALKYMFEVMTTPPIWAQDLPLKVEGGYDVCYSK